MTEGVLAVIVALGVRCGTPCQLHSTRFDCVQAARSAICKCVWTLTQSRCGAALSPQSATPPGRPDLAGTSPSSGSRCSNATSKVALFSPQWVLPLAAFFDKTHTPDFKNAAKPLAERYHPNGSRDPSRKVGYRINRGRDVLVLSLAGFDPNLTQLPSCVG